jgi:hypothetical protein
MKLIIHTKDQYQNRFIKPIKNIWETFVSSLERDATRPPTPCIQNFKEI